MKNKAVRPMLERRTFVCMSNDKDKAQLPNTYRRLGTKGILESLQGSGGSGLLGGSESSGGGDKGGENSGLHFGSLVLTNCENSTAGGIQKVGCRREQRNEEARFPSWCVCGERNRCCFAIFASITDVCSDESKILTLLHIFLPRWRITASARQQGERVRL